MGTDSPTAKLTINNSIDTTYSTSGYGATPANSMLYLHNTHGGSNTASLINFRTGSGDGVVGFVEGGGTNDADFVIQTDGGLNGVERLRITNDGKVGIGTDSPSSELHIKGASPAGIFNSQLLVDTTDTTGAEDTGSKILFGYHDGVNNRAGPYIFGANTSGQSGHYSAYLAFGTRENGSNPAERMRIDSSGLVSINPINNSYNFKVFATDTDSFFGVREDANNSVILQVDRSDGYTGFLYNGHSMALSIGGALSKGSGSFKIDHPLESKKDTHHLVHSFVEAPQADNIYRGVVSLVDGSATINLDTEAGMTEGTFVLLNTNTSCFTSNESDWDAVKGSVSGNILTINCQNESSTATVSWLVIGERHDQHMIDTDWTDENGKVIVEPLKIVEG